MAAALSFHRGTWVRTDHQACKSDDLDYVIVNEKECRFNVDQRKAGSLEVQENALMREPLSRLARLFWGSALSVGLQGCHDMAPL